MSDTTGHSVPLSNILLCPTPQARVNAVVAATYDAANEAQRVYALDFEAKMKRIESSSNRIASLNSNKNDVDALTAAVTVQRKPRASPGVEG